MKREGKKRLRKKGLGNLTEKGSSGAMEIEEVGRSRKGAPRTTFLFGDDDELLDIDLDFDEDDEPEAQDALNNEYDQKKKRLDQMNKLAEIVPVDQFRLDEENAHLKNRIEEEKAAIIDKTNHQTELAPSKISKATEPVVVAGAVQGNKKRKSRLQKLSAK